MRKQGLPAVSVMRATIIAGLLCLLQHSGSAFYLKSSHKQLSFAADESLTMKCLYSLEDDFIETELAAVREMRIVRRVGRRGWHTLAQIWLNDQEIKAQRGLDVTGQIGDNITESYLNVVWYHTSPDALGVYRCDIVGTDHTNDLVLEKTNVVTVFDKNATTKDMLLASNEHLQNLQLEFNRYKSDTEEQLRSLRNAVDEVRDLAEYHANRTQTMSGYIAEVGQKLRVEMQENFQALRANYTGDAGTCGCQVTKTTDSVRPTIDVEGEARKTTSQEEHKSSVKPHINGTTSLKTSVTLSTTTTPTTTTLGPEPEEDERGNKTWPDVKFGLPMPDSGCPQIPDGATWVYGYIGYHTESQGENLDNVSIPNHLAGPVARADNQGNHFMFISFCIKGDPVRADGTDGSSGIAPLQWPAGSYCINRVDGSCPSGFSSGYVDIDEEDTNHVRKMKSPLPDMLFFCCRKDGRASRPVRLPTQKPFFLYRFGGKCQTVRDMTVSEESVTLDTENVNNSDGYENHFHPDGHVQDVHIELCYYSHST